MPPKKPATSAIVGLYDVELMTEQELRLYIKALQEEHVRMRKARNLYHKDKTELLNILKCAQEKTINALGIEAQKSLEIQEQIIQAERESGHADLLNNITDLEIKKQREKDVIESFINIKNAEVLNKEEEKSLLKAITERDREIEHMEYNFKLILTQLKENNFEKCHKSSKRLKSNFETFVNEDTENFIRAIQEFSEHKVKNLQVTWGDIPNTKNNLFADSIAKMSVYFKDIYWKNIKTVEELQFTVMKLKKSLNNVLLHLHDITKENTELKDDEYKPVSPIPSETPSNFAKDQKFEELTYENYLLSLKLEMLNKEYTDLKEKFVNALRRIYQKADFKALLLEKKLSSLQEKPNKDIFS